MYRTQRFLLFLFLVLLQVNSAVAGTERFILDYGDAHFGGYRGEVEIYLKKALQENVTEVNVAQYLLRRVVVVARAKHGRGTAQLRIGPEMTRAVDVGQDAFTIISLENPFKESWGPWRLLLSGNIVLREVTLVVERREMAK
ncbi:MAG: hypothetical protein V2I36_06390 [Desulfopila sp.]|nr:hypothetical protein [Desulfopila sp.]